MGAKRAWREEELLGPSLSLRAQEAHRGFDSLELRRSLSKQGVGCVIRAKKRFRKIERLLNWRVSLLRP